MEVSQGSQLRPEEQKGPPVGAPHGQARLGGRHERASAARPRAPWLKESAGVRLEAGEPGLWTAMETSA